LTSVLTDPGRKPGVHQDQKHLLMEEQAADALWIRTIEMVQAGSSRCVRLFVS